MLSRRDFCKWLAVSSVVTLADVHNVFGQPHSPYKEALYYEKRKGKKVSCRLCPRKCDIDDGNAGFCRARKNFGGVLYSLGFAAPCAVHVDPIEKKPFYNYYPKTLSFSLASAGCNLRCKFCQNWQISQISPLDAKNYKLPADAIGDMAKRHNCRSVAYTYSEPTTFYEYMIEASKVNRRKGLLNVYHSNGFIDQAPLTELCKYLDAANVDLKGFSNEYYRDMCEAWLDPVLDTLKTLKRSGVWLEITNLVVPGRNDDTAMIAEMAEWMTKNLGAGTPLHFSRFFPLYKLTNLPATPVETLEKARNTAMKKGLKYVYIGNVPGHDGDNTFCPACKKMLVRRSGYSIEDIYIKHGNCKFCSEKIEGEWNI